VKNLPGKLSMTLELDKKALNNSISKAMAGLAKDLTIALNTTEQELGLSNQLEKSIVVTDRTCTVKYQTTGNPTAMQLHEGAIVNRVRLNRQPWLTNTLDHFDAAKAFANHFE
jgi:hypothetical protein